MTDQPTIPSSRDGAYERIARRVEQMQDTRLAEHHDIRRIHAKGPDGRCVEDGRQHPCPTVERIDRQPAVTA
jgi:hypothetical protein